MAEQQQNPGVVTNTFTKGMVKDYNDTFVGEGLWTHARNAVNNSHDGQLGVIGNEPANLKCIQLPYTFIGAIHITDDQWAVFSTDDTNSEIGIFDESKCSYVTKINDSCLGFKRSHPITGVSRRRFDCGRPIYWADGLNPDRFVDLDDIPFKYTENIVDNCRIRKYTDRLDCEKIRMAPLLSHPCLQLKKGNISGTLPNGSYQVAIAYSQDGIRFTNYIGLSEVQSVFTHENVSSSLELVITDIDDTYDEFELVVVGRVNGTTIAKKFGYYSTAQGTIFIDRWDQEMETVPISQVVFRGEPSEKSNAIYEVNNYLLKVGDYSKFKFNYQQQASKIISNWVAVEYPSNYYRQGGNNTGYMRDEQYSFFIRWIYNTGERSDSYHIPGREAITSDREFVFGGDAFETISSVPVTRERWQVENTATIDNIIGSTLNDGGRVIASGQMGYWESTERYPDNKPEIWGKLCGKPIRHHKMPDETRNALLNLYNKNTNTVVLLGVQFSNITHPLDNSGKPIESIVGYEILRGSREGNKTVVAKGILNNMRQYNLLGNSKLKGLYQNFPYNDLRPDVYHVATDRIDKQGGDNDKLDPLVDYRKDVFSFHSPEVTFSNPYLNIQELKVYQELSGTVTGFFEYPYRHPKVKLLNNKAGVTAAALALGIAVTTALGKGSISFGGTADMPVRTDVAGGKMNLPAVGGAAGIGTTIVNTAVIAAQVAIDIGIITASFFAISDNVIKIMNAIARKQQHALQYNSHCFYDTAVVKESGQRRREILNAVYSGTGMNSFDSDFIVNNKLRSKYVILRTSGTISNPSVEDNSRVLFDESPSPKIVNIDFNTTASTHYGAVKISIPSQYGQLSSIKQMVISGGCIHPTSLTGKMQSPVLFGGDVYINRFTEKNIMPFFNTWMLGEPDETEWDYRNFQNVPYVRFWMDSTQESYNDLSVKVIIQSPIDIDPPRVRLQSPLDVKVTLAQKKRSLNRVGPDGGIEIRNAYFYLFNSGVYDYFVESEVNIAYRDWEDDISRRHYDVSDFTDLSSMFRSDIAKSGNYYKYDYNLSISKLFGSHITWGNILGSDYDPKVAETCYVYYPSRIRYSLPQQLQSKKDNWRVFLTNNFQDFDSPVTAIKPINRTGALFMMARQSPRQFMGVEELKLDTTGAKITIGDGALFSQPLQNIVNSDTSFEYGSCQSKYGVINTVHGVFWVSQNQGKIFQYGGQINEISRNGMKYWFSRYLPSKLLAVYPDYPYYDNPVYGIGVQMMYDNTNEIIYITKRDYKPLYKDMLYDERGFYRLSGSLKQYHPFTDTNAWEDASWTISYDPKNQTWLSFHDWHPSFLLPGKQHFMSVNQDSVWKHNMRCDRYCNFYGVDYPFEVEFVSGTGQTVTSTRNVEYLLEVYQHHNSCADKFHVLDANFDVAMVYNSEQISGLLQLELKDKKNPLSMLNYPQIRNQSIGIQYSKEEHKYRFNQFWDITKDRGEFNSVNVPMFNTAPNGYEYQVNPQYVNYNKTILERKKFRHTYNKVWLRKVNSGSQKYLFKISNLKNAISPR